MLSFFGRVTDLGHFTELKVRIWFDHNDFAVPDSVVQAVLRAALANVNIEIFDLSSDTQDYYNDMAWDPHVEPLLEGLAEHKALCTLKLGVRDDAFGPDFCHLRRLLSRNRKIRVTNAQGLLYTDGASIDNLYALTRLYRGSVGLIGKPLLERSSLVATALMESASGDLQRCALLLSDHAHTV